MVLLPDPADYPDHLQLQKDKIFARLVWAIALAMLPIAGTLLASLVQEGWDVLTFVELGMYVLTWVIAFGPNSIVLKYKAGIVAACLFVTTLLDVYRYGLISATFPMLAVLPVIGTVLGGLRMGVSSLAFGVFAVVLLGWVIISGQILPPVALPDALFSTNEWAVRIVGFATASAIGIYATGFLYRFYHTANADLHKQFLALKKSQGRLAQSAKLAGLGYAITDQKNNRVEECDETYAGMHGLTADEFMSLTISKGIIGKLIHEDDRDIATDMRQRLIRGESMIAELRHRLPNGEIRSFRKTFSPLDGSDPQDARFEVVCQDVTAARQMQDQLFQTQKMDAIGKMTGGVAHDFNNLLAVTLGNLELLLDGTQDPAKQRLIQNCINATLRGSELTKNMLSFARRAPLVPTRVDLNQIVRDLNSWIARTLPSSIEVKTSLAEDLWPITVDESSSESALLNLIVNARDAMPDGGVLQIATTNLVLEPSELTVRGEKMPAGQYVVLTVSDNGAGIKPETMSRIFDPFFTTKPVGTGSGLGLAMLEGFMTQSGGAVNVVSVPGQGTSFRLYFKADDMGPEKGEHEVKAPVEPEAAIRVLLVEDHEDVRNALRTALSKQGFHVTEAVSGDAAFDIVKGQPDRLEAVDLVITDIVMPGRLQGTGLAQQLREMRPDLPIIFMSGYANEGHDGMRLGDVRLMKPVRRADLLAAIATALRGHDT